jgi:purine-cytosine permease-like protein
METPNWGIEPVPERFRVLGTTDTFLLWTNFGISILVLVSAAYLGLSLKQALLATVLGGLIGCSMLGVAALIGADARVPTKAKPVKHRLPPDKTRSILQHQLCPSGTR